jgi:hypothetical protein
MYPLNMIGKNPLKMNPRASHKPDDIERTLKVSHVEEMPTKSNNYYQDLLKKMNENKTGSVKKQPFGGITGAHSVNRSPLSMAHRSKFPQDLTTAGGSTAQGTMRQTFSNNAQSARYAA